MSLMTIAKNVIDVRKEMDRRTSQRLRILALLKSGRPVTTISLQRIAFNYTMRISELRKKGHMIEAEYVKPGLFRYYYRGQKANV